MGKIVIKIGPKGQTKVEADGYTAGGCVPVIDAMVAAIGDVTDEQKKPEFFQSQPFGQGAGQ